MDEYTTAEVATIFTNAGDSVTVINTLAALSSQTDDQISIEQEQKLKSLKSKLSKLKRKKERRMHDN